MKILITGAAGFIGSTLAERALTLGHEVVGIDCFTDYYDVALKKRNIDTLVKGFDQFSFVEGDLTRIDLAGFLQGQGFQHVYHLAGQPGVRKSWGAEFSSYMDQNVLATQRVLDAAKVLGGNAPRISYASSSSVYGQAARYPCTETDLPAPHSPYGVTKLAGEHLVSLYRENFGLTATSYRFFTVYGPRQRPDMAFSRFIAAALEGQEITVFGDGTQIRDFTFVDDVVDALMLGAQSSAELPAVVNLSGGSSASVNQVLHILRDMIDVPLRISYQGAALGDVRQTGGENRLAREALRWSPKTDLLTGLASQLGWELERRKS